MRAAEADVRSGAVGGMRVPVAHAHVDHSRVEAAAADDVPARLERERLGLYRENHWLKYSKET